MADKNQPPRDGDTVSALAGATPASAVSRTTGGRTANKKTVRKKAAVPANKTVARKKAAPAENKTVARKKPASKREKSPPSVGVEAKPVLTSEQRQRMVGEAAYLISLKRPPHMGSSEIDWLSAETVIDMVFDVKG